MICLPYPGPRHIHFRAIYEVQESFYIGISENEGVTNRHP